MSKGRGLRTTSSSICCNLGRKTLLMATMLGTQKFSLESNIREVDDNKDASTQEDISKSEGHTKYIYQYFNG